MAEQSLLVIGQQVVTPAHRRLQAAVPLGQVRRLPAQQPQPVREAPRDQRQGERVQAGRRQLQRQGQPVQLPRQLRHQRGLRRAQSEVGPVGPRPLHEERHRRDPRQLIQGRQRGAKVGHRQRRDAQCPLPAQL